MFLLQNVAQEQQWQLATGRTDCRCHRIFLLFFLRPFGLGQFEGDLFIVALCFSLLSVAVTWCYGECVFRPWVRWVKTAGVA